MNDNVISALELFNFKRTEKYPNAVSKGAGLMNSFTRHEFVFEIGYKTVKPFKWSLRSLNLIVEMYFPKYGYHKGTFEIMDQVSENRIYFDDFTSDEAGIVRRVIDLRFELYDIFFCHHLRRVIKSFNVIQERPINFEKKVEMYAVTKQYETGRWGGVDKDNYYTVYLEYDYFIVIDGEIWIDDYIRKTLHPSWIKTLDEYRDYRPTHDTATDIYRLQEAEKVLLDVFKSTYNSSDHKAYLDSLNKQ